MLEPEPTLFPEESPLSEQNHWTWIALQFLQPTEELHAGLDLGLCESLRRFGMLYPIAIKAVEDAGPSTRYKVLDGARRVVAARHLAKTLESDELQALGL